MYTLRRHNIERVVLGHRRLEYVIAALLSGLGSCGLVLAALAIQEGGHMGIFAAASLMVLAAGLMLWQHGRTQASSLIFDNPHQVLLFGQHDGLKVPLPYSRIRKFEALHVRSGDSSAWILGAQFHDGNVLPLLSGSEKRMRRRERDFREWVFLKPEAPALKTNQAVMPRHEIELPPLPRWLSWREDGPRLRSEWASRLSWGQILFSAGFVIAFALICYFSAKPAEIVPFWVLRGFSAALSLLALLILGHGIRTRERRWWLELEAGRLRWGYRRPGSRNDRQLRELDCGDALNLYWSFETPRLVALDAEGEAELRRKHRLNPSYSLHAILQMIKREHRLDMELPGFKQGELLLLQEHLFAWQARQKARQSMNDPVQSES
ncbi:MAG: hypothetical protein ACAI44_22330, partial [Candidatus Sericytochromatia bacterium]